LIFLTIMTEWRLPDIHSALVLTPDLCTAAGILPKLN